MSATDVTINVTLSIEQLLKAVQQLPAQEKMTLWRVLDTDIDRSGIRQRFWSALQTIRTSYADLSEEDVIADVLLAVREVREGQLYVEDRS
ncbi:MAG: hypothetical protein KJ063_09545 [Anaerolineae bacterium]|nr:hypothetical protein [Anaerolineae bacterium]